MEFIFTQEATSIMKARITLCPSFRPPWSAFFDYFQGGLASLPYRNGQERQRRYVQAVSLLNEPHVQLPCEGMGQLEASLTATTGKTLVIIFLNL